MRDDLLNLIPDDILNLILQRIKPTIKYTLNKDFFYKFYCYRFAIINDKFSFIHKKNLYNNNYIIKNFNYINYLIKNDINMILENIILYKSNYDEKKFIFNYKIFYKNIKFKDFIDFCYFYALKYDSVKILTFFNYISKKYNINYDLTYLNKKKHKSNNKSNINIKNNKWKA
jgi:hypothetical protein